MWLDPEDITKLNKDLDKISRKLVKSADTMNSWVDKELTYYGNEMRNTIIKSMRSTRRSSIGYLRGKNKYHYPSLPYNPPAIDYGHLVRSVMFDVGNMQMTIGSKAHEAPHGLFMEFGTKGLAGMGHIIEPRPWLAPGVAEHIDSLRASIGSVSVEMISSAFEGLI